MVLALPGQGGGGGYVDYHLDEVVQVPQQSFPIVEVRSLHQNPKKIKVQPTGQVSFTSIGNQLTSITGLLQELEQLEDVKIRRLQDQA